MRAVKPTGRQSSVQSSKSTTAVAIDEVEIATTRLRVSRSQSGQYPALRCDASRSSTCAGRAMRMPVNEA